MRRVSRHCGIPFSTLQQRLAATGTVPTKPVTVEDVILQALERALEEYKRSAAGRQVTLSGGDVTQMFLTALIAILQKAGLTVTVPTSAA
jgi:pyruvate-formate lyase-activating enzyme